MNHIETKAYAKINLSLDVVSKRDDGYHNLKTIMQSLDLYDNITVDEVSGKAISLSTNLRYLPVNEKNNAFAAAKQYMEITGIEQGLHIRIEKRIPVCAGLGGGSSDAAAVLHALNVIFDGALSIQQLYDIARKTGADVPFCLMGGTAYARGIGEILTKLPPMPFCHILLVKPPINVSTALVFKKLNLKSIVNRPDTDGLLQAINSGNYYELSKRIYNVLEQVVETESKVVHELKGRMLDYGANSSIMSGSGPTVFGLFDNYSKAQSAYKGFKEQYADVYLCKPQND